MGLVSVLACLNFTNSLTNEQKEDLEQDITKEEVKRAMTCLGLWSTFFINGDIPNGCNSNFIALIPKIIDANMVKDFRPISLIGSLYKIIAKLLANRLVGVLSNLINEVQSAFVADRQILDGPFILNEVLQWCRKKRKHALIFKVDFEKAYDSVRWDFLDDVLDKFGFGVKWRNWIQSCLRSSRGSILINGSPTKEFQFFRGLKQGDPLSPFLFILVMESLHISFQRVVDAGLFNGINFSSTFKVKGAKLSLFTFRRNARSGNRKTSLILSRGVHRKQFSLVPRVDRYIWSLENDGSFSVASIRKTLDDNRFQEESLSTRWVKSVPIKVNILAWKVKSNALPTRFNISRRGMDIDSSDLSLL
ncbi:RNA-directed DNA polymerase, eukaryota [Tanacetum coccineum]